ncbi:MAG: SDR family NAD(P)-dependent oxidoreductase [Chloroflexi bacterium]|nr:SDR family NAD(P)-dependent oxidoreductase [Chloroflexota bacterium]
MVIGQEWPGVRGKRVILTGGTNGIGLAGARQLAELGAELTIVGRSAQRAREATASIGRPVDVLLADLSAQADVRRLAEQILERYPRVDVLINNAGAMFGARQVSVDGIELTWAVNHLAPFLLTNLLLTRLEASAPARVITTASAAHYRATLPFDDLQAERERWGLGFRRYGETKLANVLFTRELARRLAGTQVTANCFHPGFVRTGFNHDNGVLIGLGMQVAHLVARRPEKGAETLVWLADSPLVSAMSGAYFMDRRERTPSAAARDAQAAKRLWQVSEEEVSSAGNPLP